MKRILLYLKGFSFFEKIDKVRVSMKKFPLFEFHSLVL
ncbi:hypothetical protein A33Q_1381 [Indibacter alkaliphilus LW1]|uniref:Uncharacterized protein n=1 Tax=Indibacter alkaliphilus (strain CCUG 57479 / KCTC 22604 / LW1) TaxID=1189612 RepID=S2DI99_INDAL|nr:hypothetical protein A33Q_1381 [Indibacter alkaliphilus LW1]